MYRKNTKNRYWTIYQWLNPMAKFAGYTLKEAKQAAQKINDENPNIEVKILKEVGVIR